MSQLILSPIVGFKVSSLWIQWSLLAPCHYDILQGKKSSPQQEKFHDVNQCFFFHCFPVILNLFQFNFSWYIDAKWDCKKINFKFHRNCENTGKIFMHKIWFCEIWSIWSLFSWPPIRTFSLELFHKTYHIYSPRKE